VNPTTYLPSNFSEARGNSAVIAKGDMTPSINDSTDFGYVNNTVSSSRTYTIYNTGSGVLTISGITVTGTDASYFSIAGAPSTVAANSNATFRVVFAPANTTATKNATI